MVWVVCVCVCLCGVGGGGGDGGGVVVSTVFQAAVGPVSPGGGCALASSPKNGNEGPKATTWSLKCLFIGDDDVMQM